MNGWFLAIIIIYTLTLGMTASDHGKERTGKHNFWGALIVSLIMIWLIFKSIVTGF